MGSSKIRRALGAVKDSTSIGLAKVGNSSALSDLDVAIVKATRHDEYPAEERHIREILSLTCYSRAYISACVATLSRRLGKTKSWAVALKTLVLIHRLLSEGDPAYEQEIFFATRRGTRMLNMSDFRDTSRSDAWDYSAFVRTFALYLDERLDFRMHGRRARRRSRSVCDEDEAQAAAAAAANSSVTPVREMKTDRLFIRTQHLQQLLDRFLACRPTGSAKNNRIVAVALYPLVKESYQLYFDLQELMSIFIDRFMELEVPECVRIYDIFCRLAKQFEELDHFYSWCKTAGVSRPSEFPDVERITPKKLEVMDDFIRDKSALSRPKEEPANPDDDAASVADYDVNAVRALPAPETTSEEEAAPALLANQQEEEIKQSEESDPGPADKPEDVDFLNLRADPVISGQEHGDQLALALFDGAPAAQPPGPPAWEAFREDTDDWEKALVVSASNLSGQKPSLGGGFDTSLLDSMYSQGWHASSHGFLDSGSASSVALPVPSAQPVLALPAPPVRPGGGNNSAGTAAEDPFAASLAVPPPSYVQMSEMEKKQQLLLEEQRVWQQYARDGMQGQLGMGRMQQNGRYPMGGYTGPMF